MAVFNKVLNVGRRVIFGFAEKNLENFSGKFSTQLISRGTFGVNFFVKKVIELVVKCDEKSSSKFKIWSSKNRFTGCVVIPFLCFKSSKAVSDLDSKTNSVSHFSGTQNHENWFSNGSSRCAFDRRNPTFFRDCLRVSAGNFERTSCSFCSDTKVFSTCKTIFETEFPSFIFMQKQGVNQ